SISSSSLDANSPEQSVPRSNNISSGAGITHIHQSPLGGLAPLSVGGGGHSPHPSINNQGGASGPVPMPPSKQGFLFQPVSEAMGSPSSTSSSSSSSLSMHHLHPQPDQQSHHADRSPLAHAHSQMSPQQPLRTHSSMSNDGNSHNSNDIYMSDTEMRDHSDMASKPSEGFSLSDLN
ncbi:unnamed protein product, partial [Lymnaea stagnalis]